MLYTRSCAAPTCMLVDELEHKHGNATLGHLYACKCKWDMPYAVTDIKSMGMPAQPQQLDTSNVSCQGLSRKAHINALAAFPELHCWKRHDVALACNALHCMPTAESSGNAPQFAANGDKSAAWERTLVASLSTSTSTNVTCEKAGLTEMSLKKVRICLQAEFHCCMGTQVTIIRPIRLALMSTVRNILLWQE